MAKGLAWSGDVAWVFEACSRADRRGGGRWRLTEGLEVFDGHKLGVSP